MHWVIQNNIFQEEGYEDFIESVKRLNIPHTIVKVIPFVHELEPHVEVDDEVMVFGSVVMSKIAKKYGWHTFLNDNFDLEVWTEKYKGYLLNEYLIWTLDYLENSPLNFYAGIFIRPISDDKSFNGQVLDTSYVSIYNFIHDLYNSGYATPETKIALSSVKHIEKEYRFYVVDGWIQASSQYKMNGKFTSAECTDAGAELFAEEMINIWQPARAFVLDVALVEGEYKVIEIGNINHAGFYKANVRNIVEAIYNMEFIGDWR